MTDLHTHILPGMDDGAKTVEQSLQMLQMQLEQNKLERKVKSREQRLAEAERQFALKQQKKKEQCFVKKASNALRNSVVLHKILY